MEGCLYRCRCRWYGHPVWFGDRCVSWNPRPMAHPITTGHRCATAGCIQRRYMVTPPTRLNAPVREYAIGGHTPVSKGSAEKGESMARFEKKAAYISPRY